MIVNTKTETTISVQVTDDYSAAGTTSMGSYERLLPFIEKFVDLKPNEYVRGFEFTKEGCTVRIGTKGNSL